MKASSLVFAMHSGLFAGNTPGGILVLGLPAVLLVIVAAVLLFHLKSYASLRARVEKLERSAMPIADDGSNEKTSGPAPEPVASKPLKETDAQSIPHDILTAIAAAIHVTLEGSARIVAITPRGDDRVWSLEGRRQIFQSHQIR